MLQLFSHRGSERTHTAVVIEESPGKQSPNGQNRGDTTTYMIHYPSSGLEPDGGTETLDAGGWRIGRPPQIILTRTSPSLIDLCSVNEPVK